MFNKRNFARHFTYNRQDRTDKIRLRCAKLLIVLVMIATCTGTVSAQSLRDTFRELPRKNQSLGTLFNDTSSLKKFVAEYRDSIRPRDYDERRDGALVFKLIPLPSRNAGTKTIQDVKRSWKKTFANGQSQIYETVNFGDGGALIARVNPAKQGHAKIIFVRGDLQIEVESALPPGNTKIDRAKYLATETARLIDRALSEISGSGRSGKQRGR